MSSGGPTLNNSHPVNYVSPADHMTGRWSFVCDGIEGNEMQQHFESLVCLFEHLEL